MREGGTPKMIILSGSLYCSTCDSVKGYPNSASALENPSMSSSETPTTIYRSFVYQGSV